MAHEQIEKPVPITQSGYSEAEEMVLRMAVEQGLVKEVRHKDPDE